MFDEALLDKREKSVIGGLPYLFVEYLNFDGAVVAGGIYGLPQFSQLDDAVTHHGAAHQDAGQRHRPIGDVKARNSSRANARFAALHPGPTTRGRHR